LNRCVLYKQSGTTGVQVRIHSCEHDEFMVIYSTASTLMSEWTGRDLQGDDRGRVSGLKRLHLMTVLKNASDLEELEVSPSSCAGQHGP
jgi:hypothetical protein